MPVPDDFWDEEGSRVSTIPPPPEPREKRRHLMTDEEWFATCSGNSDHPDNKDPFDCYQCYGCRGIRTNRSAHTKHDGVWEVLFPQSPSVCAGPEDQPHPEVLVQAQQPCPVCRRNGYRKLEVWD